MTRLYKRFEIFIASFFFLLGLVLTTIYGYNLPIIILVSIGTLISFYGIFIKAVQALRFKMASIELLVSIAVIGAYVIGEYFEALAVSYLFMLGHFLEKRALQRTRRELEKLINLKPNQARLLKDGERMVSPEELEVGDIVFIKTGEKIAVDGSIIEGTALIDESLITGESLPKEKTVGDTVYASTIINSGYAIIKATKTYENSAFSKIIEMVINAQEKKARTQKFMERFSKYYTPFIILLSALIYFLTRDFKQALTVLVISCPGALVISTPVSIVAGIGRAARLGILFKGGDTIEGLAKSKVIAFDKTGTSTIGKLQVSSLTPFGISEEELLSIAAAGEFNSEHPFGRAIIDEVNSRNVEILKADTTKILTGKGLRFTINNIDYFLGNQKLLQEINPPLSDEQEKAITQTMPGASQAILLTEKEVLGIIWLKDRLRPEAKALILELNNSNYHLTMLSGDRKEAAAAIAEECGLQSFEAELLPQEKVQHIQDLRKELGPTIFVGDGVNDTPALVTADYGIALGAQGKDIAMETADIVILGEELPKLQDALLLSKKTRTNMKENIVFALLVVIVLLVGVLMNKITLSIGMLVHEASVLLVILNAIRLNKYKKHKS